METVHHWFGFSSKTACGILVVDLRYSTTSSDLRRATCEGCLAQFPPQDRSVGTVETWLSS